MSYKEKFEASEHRAHYKNIATKILKEMSILRSLVESSPTASRRWVWELIQNAKDVHPVNGVKIKIDYNLIAEYGHLSFRHNGEPFSADNIRFLIEQISSKDRTKDEHGKRKNTGKFGTGFLTTHLLSEIVSVEGVAKEPELDYRLFDLLLDRSGFELDQITDGVENAKKSVENLDEEPPYHDYQVADFNTLFYYPLKDKVSIRVAQSGLNDLENCLPYTLMFVEEIKEVEITPKNLVYTREKEPQQLDEGIDIFFVSIKDSQSKVIRDELTFVRLRKGFTTIAMPIFVANDAIELLPISDKIPKLFCDFPLIGTEKFPFPVIINDPDFNPTDPRDGVYLTTSQRPNPLSDQNKNIISSAINLYYELLSEASSHNWQQLHLLAVIHQITDVPDWLDDKWFRLAVLNPIRKQLLYSKIVKTANGSLAAILLQGGKKYMWFPHSIKKEIRTKIWELANSWFPHCLPRDIDVELWYRHFWDECGKLSVFQFATFVQETKTLAQLSELLKGRTVHKWLNEFYELIKMEEKEYDSIINSCLIFPNQNGEFCKKNKLNYEVGTIDSVLKDILFLLGKDIRDELADTELNIQFETDKGRDEAYIVREITAEVNEKANDREVAKNYKEGFKKLLLWFQKYPETAKSYFPTIYRNKHLLYDDEEIMENISKAEQLKDFLEDLKVKDLDELRKLLAQSQDPSENSLLPVTEKILASMGISSVEEWHVALKDKNLAALFSHESTPTTDMFVYVQGLIGRAKANIIKHLKTLSNYDLTHLDDTTAPTILAGILKDGRSLSIVARPAYNGEVIIYYGSERDILDFEPSELWVDDGDTQRIISLGHILKMANIVKFPV
jgi:hypothetical protein